MGMMSAAHAGVRRLNVPPGLCFPPFIATANEENQVQVVNTNSCIARQFVLLAQLKSLGRIAIIMLS